MCFEDFTEMADYVNDGLAIGLKLLFSNDLWCSGGVLAWGGSNSQNGHKVLQERGLSAFLQVEGAISRFVRCQIFF